MPQIRELQKGFNPLPFQTKEETQNHSYYDCQENVSIHFLFKQRKKQVLLQVSERRDQCFNPLPFQTKEETLGHYQYGNFEIGFNPLPFQTKEETIRIIT
ncbi:hypothetical protein LEP1GSC035_1795 [Leptospira noguchii str. 2007001578]|uniref:Uncharacterized protein n=1 Tax=Leptospira noguchii str. 2007001578 TaxID=1049974 RepID=A0ABN0J0L4_9LEPT|nr:hypothetical protein LEP1GSC035_1795 [Leptospira noguchii str. 2007001578]